MMILATNFYDVQVAYSAVEAVHIAEQFKPHVLIADVTLPDMDGFKLAAQFDIRHPDCRVLLMSAGFVWAPPNGRGVRVVQKASVLEEAFQLLDDCRQSEEV
jgi:response regulator RpfG family c-di-GMP phosphodiesterase